MALIETTQRNRYTEIVMNDPATRNAITGPMAEELAEAVRDVNADPASQLMLLRGSEGAFCSGLNLKQFNADPQPEWLPRFSQIWQQTHRCFYDSNKPIICALEKFAINGGAALALAADLLIVGDDSYLHVGEVQRGMSAPNNIAWLRLKFSESVAIQLALTGRRFLGPDLVRLGVAFEAPVTAEVLDRARTLCEDLANYPEGALARIKTALGVYRESESREWFQPNVNSSHGGD